MGTGLVCSHCMNEDEEPDGGSSASISGAGLSLLLPIVSPFTGRSGKTHSHALAYSIQLE